MPIYLDTSALIKAVAVETESEAFVSWFDRVDRIGVSSDLTRVELIRVVGRRDAGLIPRISPNIVQGAAALNPPALRSLDALHLASTLSIGSELEGLDL